MKPKATRPKCRRCGAPVAKTGQLCPNCKIVIKWGPYYLVAAPLSSLF